MTAAQPEPRERPTLLYSYEVRNFLDKGEGQIRRVIKPQPLARKHGWWEWGYKFGAPKATSPRSSMWHGDTWKREAGSAPIDEFCPQGRIGDRIWVRETWQRMSRSHMTRIAYRADGIVQNQTGNKVAELCPWELNDSGRPGETVAEWRSATQMPRWASRLTLEITEVRVQRLQEISEEDAEAEGVGFEETRCDGECGATPCSMLVPAFSRSWDLINGKKAPWSSNPWVWVLTLRRLP